MGGAPSLPKPGDPGYTSYTDAYGKQWTVCDCLAKWLPVHQRLLLAQGLIKSSIDIWQTTGGAPASGGTHTQGGVYDLLYQTSDAHIRTARNMGAASWARRLDEGDWTKPHQHGILIGCPHNEPARYQITAMQRGYSGLGQATSGPYAGMWGYGSLDRFKPAATRTWQQGIAWAQTEIARLEEDIMASIDDLRTVIREEVGKATWTYPLKNRRTGDSWSAGSWVEGGALLSGDAASGIAAVAKAADVDEAALAAALAPVVRQAVIDSGQPETVADAVVAKLGDALKP